MWETICIFILVAWALSQLTFIFYLAIMNARGVKDQIPTAAKFFIYPALIVGVLLDLALNVLVGTVLFLDPPREAMFTARLKRYRKDGEDLWRGKLACWFCEKLLNIFDPSRKHC